MVGQKIHSGFSNDIKKKPEWIFQPTQCTYVCVYCFCYSVTKLHLTLRNPTDGSTPGFPVLRHLLKFAQTHIHWISNAIQPSHPVAPFSSCLQSSSASGSLQWVSSSHQVAKVLELQHQSFQRIFRVDFLLGLTGLISLQPRDSQESSPYPDLKASILWHSAFFMVQLYIYWKNHSFDYTNLGWQSDVCFLIHCLGLS